jgi:hypothetical protein
LALQDVENHDGSVKPLQLLVMLSSDGIAEMIVL